MKRSLTPLATSLAALLFLAACGHARKAAHPNLNPGTATPASEAASRETTPDGLTYDGDDAAVRFYGRRAGSLEQQAIGSLVKLYYAVAAKHDGATACRLIHTITIEATVESYAERPGGHTENCGTILSGLYERHHRELVRDSATLKIIDMRVGGLTALVLLRFAMASQPVYLEVHREGPTWKLWTVLASHMP